jgi:L-ascorbate metabolism protein UlaG (beta-lactamase superfamily)
MNIPVERMMPAAAAECARAFGPKVVYIYHYDQDFASKAANPRATPPGRARRPHDRGDAAGLKDAMKGSPIEVRSGAWYP